MRLLTIGIVCLDVRLTKFTEEKQALRTEIEQLHQQLISAKTQRRSGSQNGPIDDEDYEDAQSKTKQGIFGGEISVHGVPFFIYRRSEQTHC